MRGKREEEETGTNMSEEVSKKSTEDGTRISIGMDARVEPREGRRVMEEGMEVACGNEVNSDRVIVDKRE